MNQLEKKQIRLIFIGVAFAFVGLLVVLFKKFLVARPLVLFSYPSLLLTGSFLLLQGLVATLVLRNPNFICTATIPFAVLFFFQNARFWLFFAFTNSLPPPLSLRYMLFVQSVLAKLGLSDATKLLFACSSFGHATAFSDGMDKECLVKIGETFLRYKLLIFLLFVGASAAECFAIGVLVYELVDGRKARPTNIFLDKVTKVDTEKRVERLEWDIWSDYTELERGKLL